MEGKYDTVSTERQKQEGAVYTLCILLNLPIERQTPMYSTRIAHVEIKS